MTTAMLVSNTMEVDELTSNGLQPHPPAKSKFHRRPVANGFLPSLVSQLENGHVNGNGNGVVHENGIQSPTKGRKGGLPEVAEDSHKVCYFFHDGEPQFQNPVKLAIRSQRYKKIDGLLNELTEKMPELTFGVRAIYTPSGMHAISSVDQLINEGRYVCSSKPNRGKGIDVLKLGRAPRWSNARPPSGRRLYSLSLRLYKDPKRKSALNEPSFVSAPPVLNSLKESRIRKDCKKLYVRRLDDPKRKQVYLLNTRTTVDFDDFLIDLSTLLQCPVHNVYTMTGGKVSTVADVFNGPNEYFAETGEWHAAKKQLPNVIQANKNGNLPAVTRASAPGGMLHVNTHSNGVRKRKSKKPRSRNKWQVLIKTSDEEGAGTTANVALVVYGENGKTHRRFDLQAPLNSDAINAFQDGSTDAFELSLQEITKIYKIRLEHDEVGLHPLWCVDSVTMKSENGVQLEFECGQWLARDLRDCESFCEMPAKYPEEEAPAVLSYLVTITTSSSEKSGTSGRVYVQLFGEFGDTGKRELYQRLNGAEKPFQQGSFDEFRIKAVDLGKLNSLLVTLQAEEARTSWFLDKIVVAEENEGREYLFKGIRQLDTMTEDGKAEVLLDLLDEEGQERAREAALWVFEKWKFNPGNVIRLYSTSNNLALRLHSDKSADFTGDYSESQTLFVVASRRGMSCVLKSYFLTESYLHFDPTSLTSNTYVSLTPSPFTMRVKEDRSIQLEASFDAENSEDKLFRVKWTDQAAKLTTVNASFTEGETSEGSPTELGKLMLTAKFTTQPASFFVHCKNTFRPGNIIMISTVSRKLLAVDANGVFAAGTQRSKFAHFRVVAKCSESPEFKRVRLFESVAHPDKFLRIQDGICDCEGTRDCPGALFKVNQIKLLGYITLESHYHRGLFVGVDDENRVKTTQGDESHVVRLYPEVVSRCDDNFRLQNGAITDRSNRSARSQVLSAANTRSDLKNEPEIAPSNDDAEKPPETDLNILSLKSESDEKQAVDQAASYEENGNHETDVEVPEEPDHGHFDLHNFDPSSLEDGDWLVAVYTSETLQNASAALTIYTDEGCSGQIILGTAGGTNEEEWFHSDSVDEFKVNLRGLGTIFKLRVELIPNGPDIPCYPYQPHWKLHQIELLNPRTKEHIRLKFDRCLTRLVEDFEIVRELAVHRPPLSPRATTELPDNASPEDRRRHIRSLERERIARDRRNLALVRYEIEIYTEDPTGIRKDRHREEREGASSGSESGTFDAHVANVFVAFFGEHGDCGKRVLYRNRNTISTLAPRVTKKPGRKVVKRESRRYLFLPGHVDEFAVESVWLGKLKKCVIGLERCVWPENDGTVDVDSDANALRHREVCQKCRTMRLSCSKITIYDPYEDVHYEFQNNRELFLDEHESRCDVKLRWKSSYQAPPGSTPARQSRLRDVSSIDTDQSELYSSEPLNIEASEIEQAVSDEEEADEEDVEDVDVEAEEIADEVEEERPAESAACQCDIVDGTTCRDDQTQSTPVHHSEAAVQTESANTTNITPPMQQSEAIESILLTIADSVSTYEAVQEVVRTIVGELIETASRNIEFEMNSRLQDEAVEPEVPIEQLEPAAVEESTQPVVIEKQRGKYLVEIWTVSPVSPRCASSARIELRSHYATSHKRVLCDYSVDRDKKALFQADSVDRFLIDCGDIGDIDTVKLLHDAVGVDDNEEFEWCISKLVVSCESRRWVVRYGCTVRLSNYIRTAECSMVEEKNYLISFMLGKRFGNDTDLDTLSRVSIVLNYCESDSKSVSATDKLPIAIASSEMFKLNNETVEPKTAKEDASQLIKAGSKVQYRVRAPAVGKLISLTVATTATGFGNGFYLDGLILEVFDGEADVDQSQMNKDFYAFLCTAWFDSSVHHSADLLEQTFLPLTTSASMLTPTETHESCILEIESGADLDSALSYNISEMNVVTFTFFDLDGHEVAMQKLLIDSPLHRAYVDFERLDRVVGLRVDCESNWWHLKEVSLRLMRMKDSGYCGMPVNKWFGIRRKNALNVRDFIFPNKLLCRDGTDPQCDIQVRNYYILLETSGIRRLATVIQAGTAIFVTVKGRTAESGRIRLSSSNFVKAFPICAELKRELCVFFIESFALGDILKVTIEIEPLKKDGIDGSQSFEINDEITKLEREDASSFFSPVQSPVEAAMSEKKKEILQIEKVAVQENLLDIKQLNLTVEVPISLPPTGSSGGYSKHRIFPFEFCTSRINVAAAANTSRLLENMDGNSDWSLSLYMQAQLCSALPLEEASYLKLLKQSRFLITVGGLLGETALAELSDQIFDPSSLSFGGATERSVSTFDIPSLNVGAITKIRCDYSVESSSSNDSESPDDSSLSEELAKAIEFRIFAAKMVSKSTGETLRFSPECSTSVNRGTATEQNELVYAQLPANSFVEMAAMRPDCCPLSHEVYTVTFSIAKQWFTSASWMSSAACDDTSAKQQQKGKQELLKLTIEGEFGKSPPVSITKRDLLSAGFPGKKLRRMVHEKYETTVRCVSLGDLKAITLSFGQDSTDRSFLLEDVSVSRKLVEHHAAAAIQAGYRCETNKFGPKQRIDCAGEHRLVLESTSFDCRVDEFWKVKLQLSENCDDEKLAKVGFFVQFCTANDNSAPTYLQSTAMQIEVPVGERGSTRLNFEDLVKVRFGLSREAELRVTRFELMNLATTLLCVIEEHHTITYSAPDSTACDAWKEVVLDWPGRPNSIGNTASNEVSQYEVSLMISDFDKICADKSDGSQFAAEFPSIYITLVGEMGTSGTRCLYSNSGKSTHNQSLREKLQQGRNEKATSVELAGSFECVSLGPLRETHVAVAAGDTLKTIVIDAISVKTAQNDPLRFEVKRSIPTDSESPLVIPLI